MIKVLEMPRAAKQCCWTKGRILMYMQNKTMAENEIRKVRSMSKP